MSKSIRLSPKHGVNPTIPFCLFCNEPKHEVILAGYLPGDQEAPTRAVWDRQPCEKCKEHMASGVVLISVRDGESGDNPYRTGGWVVVTDDAIRKVIQTPEVRDAILKRRVAFIPDEVWYSMGLPRGEEVNRG